MSTLILTLLFVLLSAPPLVAQWYWYEKRIKAYLNHEILQDNVIHEIGKYNDELLLENEELKARIVELEKLVG